MNAEKPVVIIGAGGHGRVLLDICLVSGRQVAGFLDKDPDLPPKIHGSPVLGYDDRLNDAAFVASHDFVLGVGDAAIRRTLIGRLDGAKATAATLIHPSAVVSEFAKIGSGTTIHAGAVICIDAKIGAHCVINTRASVDHDCVLEDGVQISPGATLAGGVTCGRDVFVGTGASILPGVTVNRNAVVGGGSSAARDVAEEVTVYGVPARIVRPAR